MKSLLALIRREFLEHRGPFLIAPAMILLSLTALMIVGISTEPSDPEAFEGPLPVPLAMFRIAVTVALLGWLVYLHVALTFYFSDSFSADRRNNALLFWKSMPQSDLKVLGSKALAGVSVFTLLIFCFALVTCVIMYPLMVLAARHHPDVTAPGFGPAMMEVAEYGLTALLLYGLAILWSAPLLALVAGLSTRFRRWSMPLAILLPSSLVFLEYLNSLRGGSVGRPIAEYLAWRLDAFPNEADASVLVVSPDGGPPFAMLRLILAGYDWLHMGLGLMFAAVIVYLASEYRRRRIDA